MGEKSKAVKSLVYVGPHTLTPLTFQGSLKQASVSASFHITPRVPELCGSFVNRTGLQSRLKKKKGPEVQPWNQHSSSFLSFFFRIYLFFNWRVIALQNCVGFCQTSAWISHRYTYAPALEPPSHIPSCPTPWNCYRKIWKASEMCASSLDRGHANLKFINIRATKANTRITI